MTTTREKASVPISSLLEAEGLKLVERWLSGIVGVAFGVAGICAVFVSKNQIGTTALIVVGGLLLFLAATGSAVKRAKCGDKEVEFAFRRARAFAEAVKDEPEEVAEKAADALEAVDPIAAWEVRRVQYRSTLANEKYVKELGDNLMGIPEVMSVTTPTVVSDVSADLLVRYGDKRIAVEIKKYSPSYKLAANVVLQARGFLGKTSEFSGVIVVSTAEPTERARSLANEYRIPIVVWNDSGDNDALVQALRAVVDG